MIWFLTKAPSIKTSEIGKLVQLNSKNQPSQLRSSSDAYISPVNEEKYSKENHQKTMELIEVFDNLETKFKREYFF
ncbi:MAG: hypothetical protein IPJ13_22555 [Saprospiraceae bacterium]|nr:hypothetical protein [Saprospiraceae bacterium]